MHQMSNVPSSVCLVIECVLNYLTEIIPLNSASITPIELENLEVKGVQYADKINIM